MSKFRFEESFGQIVGEASTNLFKNLSRSMKEADLPITPDQFRVMTHLWQKDGRSQQELAVLSCRNRANVTRILDILEREGIVERHDNPNDRRVFNIYLTEKGKSIEKETARCARRTLDEALKGLTGKEIETCKKVLKKSIENLK